MSDVTNVILNMGVMTEEEAKDMLQKVNAFFDGRQRGFISMDDEALPSGWYGGSKMLECDLAIGAFNHLNLAGLIEHIRSLSWSLHQDTQLMIKEQNDDRFRIINVFPD